VNGWITNQWRANRCDRNLIFQISDLKCGSD
jgi:hypothetical protein